MWGWDLYQTQHVANTSEHFLNVLSSSLWVMSMSTDSCTVRARICPSLTSKLYNELSLSSARWPKTIPFNSVPSSLVCASSTSKLFSFDRSIGRVSTTALITGYNANQWPKMQKWTNAAIDQTSLKSIALKNLTSRASPTPQVSAHVFAIIWVFKEKGWI